MEKPAATPKRKYETPTIVDLGELMQGHGACESGGAPSGQGIGYCVNGAQAKGKCTTGGTY